MEVDPADGEDLPARLAETHISLLFHVGDRVYKLRKPVHFGFVDFRTRESRLRDCEREVDLNRRLSPDVYLGVADVRMDGEPIDHMVVMRRLPEGRNLSRMAERGESLSRPLSRSAEKLARFHSTAERSVAITSEASPAALDAGWEAHFAETDQFVGTMLDAGVEADIRSLSRRWIEGHQGLLLERCDQGHVCDGHGDILADDIFDLDDGVAILDCVEFDDRLRYVDVVADVAFLVMDLERLGRPDAARRFLERYRHWSGAPIPESLTHYYCASRAYIRAKVSCLRASQGVDRARGDARALQALSLEHLRNAGEQLVLVGGLPGTGKSTLAADLAAARGWTVLRSDEIRMEGASDDVRGSGPDPSDRYGEERTEAVYRELLRQAGQHLAAGRSVVLDASWVDCSWRRLAQSVADDTMSRLVELCCECSPEEADRRIALRLSEHRDVSEATPEVRAAMSARMDPWESALKIDTTDTSLSQAVDAALNACPGWFDLRAGDLEGAVRP